MAHSECHDTSRGSLRTACHWLLEACIWMAPVFGPMPAEVIAHRCGMAGPEPAAARSGGTLSRADQSRWAALVKELG